MKRTIIFLLSVLLTVNASAEIDISGMSFNELIALRQKVDIAIWQSDGWQEVSVPAGLYEVGSDIPSGRWAIKSNAIMCMISVYPSEAAARSNSILETQEIYVLNANDSCTVSLTDGQYIEIASGMAVFAPFVSASLGFK